MEELGDSIAKRVVMEGAVVVWLEVVEEVEGASSVDTVRCLKT